MKLSNCIEFGIGDEISFESDIGEIRGVVVRFAYHHDVGVCAVIRSGLAFSLRDIGAFSVRYATARPPMTEELRIS